jgi:beta-glucosidase
MLNKKFPTLLSMLAAGLFAAGAACTLPPPNVSTTTGQGFTCVDDTGADGGTDDGGGADAADDGGADGGGDAGSGINTVITPVACDGTNAIPFKYAPGYTTDPAIKAEVDTAIAQMNLHDKATQMRGTLYGSSYSKQYTHIQQSLDTSSIRGFRYRDASRGVNFAEDMDGVKPNAGTQNGEKTGYSTAFPVSMARGAAFDLDLEYAIGEAIGDEMQASKQSLLLAPCMNLLRHPFWGRAQETYGEDSYQIGRLASAMVVGVQQHILANAKHFMAYDIEVNRAFNDSELDEQTLRESYGRHFRMVVQDGGVGSVMASYNKVNGTKSTNNAHTLTDVLRTDFGFKGFILSDWWAMPNGDNAATDTSTLVSTAVQAVKAGLDVELPWALNYGQLENIVNSNFGLTEADITTSARRILEQKFRFNADPLQGGIGSKANPPKTAYVKSAIMCDGAHVRLSEKAALESMVLLKNANDTLPINAAVGKIAVVGGTLQYKTSTGSLKTGGVVNFATDVRGGDLGSSRVFSEPSEEIGPFKGICLMAGGTPNADGTSCDTSPINVVTATNNGTDLSPVTQAASDADFVVVMAGLTAEDEGEEYTTAGDRTSFALDAKQADPDRIQYINLQNSLIQAVAALGKPMVVVLEGGSVIDMPWLDTVPSVVMAWYPGMVGGRALAKLLFGQANFSGKLPFTWGKSKDQYDTWNGNGITPFSYYTGYHWFDVNGITPLFPFGYGLSYTKFEYRKLQLGCSDMSKGAIMPVVVNVANTGNVAGDEIAFVFVSYPESKADRRFSRELKGFARVHLEAGEEKQVTIPVRLADLDYFKMDAPGATTGHWVVEDGNVNIMVGGASSAFPLMATVKVNGYGN